jgi:hypothetical protein
VFTLSESFDDKCEVEEADEEYVELLEPGEDSAEALESSEQPFDLVAFLVESTVVSPGFDAVGLWRNHRNHPQIEHQLPCLIALIGSIHQHRQAFRHSGKLPQQLPAFGSIVRVARRHVQLTDDYDVMANLIAEFLPIYEITSPTDPFFQLLRFEIFLTIIIPKLAAKYQLFDVGVEFKKLFGFPIETYTNFIASFALHAQKTRSATTAPDAAIEVSLRHEWFKNTTLTSEQIDQALVQIAGSRRIDRVVFWD